MKEKIILLEKESDLSVTRAVVEEADDQIMEEWLDHIFESEANPKTIENLSTASLADFSRRRHYNNTSVVDDVSILDKVIVKTKKLNLKEDPSRKDNFTPADNSLVATYKFLCRVGHVFALKKAVESYFKETHHLLGFFIWSIHIFLCYHPIYLIYIPHLAGFFFLLFHRLYLTKYKYSSKISFEQIETTILADSRVTSSPPARLALNNFSIFQNLNDMNTSTGEFLDTFDGIVNFIENWMNEPPVVTYSKWLALIFSFFALNILISLFHMTDIMAVGGTVLWLLSHWKIRNFVVAWTAVLAHEYSKSMVPSRSDMLRHESCRSTGRRASEGSSASLILTESTLISKHSVSERIKLFLFRIIHYFLSLRILDTVFHDPQQSIEDFDLDPSLFE